MKHAFPQRWAAMYPRQTSHKAQEPGPSYKALKVQIKDSVPPQSRHPLSPDASEDPYLPEAIRRGARLKRQQDYEREWNQQDQEWGANAASSHAASQLPDSLMDLQQQKQIVMDELRMAKEEAEAQRRKILAKLGTRLAGQGGRGRGQRRR